MIARNYFFTTDTAYDIKETMYKMQAHLENPLMGTDPAHWTREFTEIHTESYQFSVVMWDLMYDTVLDPDKLMWCPVNKCYVHVEWFFIQYGVEVPVPDEVQDDYAFTNLEIIESLAELSDTTSIDSFDYSIGSFSLDLDDEKEN